MLLLLLFAAVDVTLVVDAVFHVFFFGVGSALAVGGGGGVQRAARSFESLPIMQCATSITLLRNNLDYAYL